MVSMKLTNDMLPVPVSNFLCCPLVAALALGLPQLVL